MFLHNFLTIDYKNICKKFTGYENNIGGNQKSKWRSRQQFIRVSC